MTDGQIATAVIVLNLAVAGIGATWTHRPRRDDENTEVAALTWDGAVRRKRNAKRINEHLKLGATLLNNAGLAGIVTGIVAPTVNGSLAQATQEQTHLGWQWYVIVLPSSALLILLAHLTLRMWQSEE